MSRSSHVTAPHLSSPLKLTDCEGGTSSRRFPGHEAATAARDGESGPDAGQHQHRHQHQHPRVTEALPFGCALAGSFSQTAHLWVPSCRFFFLLLYALSSLPPLPFPPHGRHLGLGQTQLGPPHQATFSFVVRLSGSIQAHTPTLPCPPVRCLAASLPLCLSAPLSEEGHFTTAEYK